MTLRIDEIFGFKYADINQFLVKIGTNLLLAIIILLVGFWLTNFVSRAISRVLQKSNTDEGLVTFSRSLISMGLKIMVIITAITQLGVEMTSFVAILGAAGLAIGMAFSGTLSNFAGGIMILVLKPFKVGDTILTQGEQGIVKEIQIFNTYLYTTDNKVIVLPNGPVANGNIVNFTKADMRRVDIAVSIAYGDDVEKAKILVANLVKDDDRVDKSHETFVGIASFGASSINLTVRVWAHADLYNDVFFDLSEKIYTEFPKAGLSFPYPKLDVHIESERHGQVG